MFTLNSTKGTKIIDGSLEEAIRAAVQMDADLQPAYGVTVEDEDGTIAQIDGREIESDRYMVCISSDGWSLHTEGSTDEAIACGDAPPVASGPWA